MKAWWIQEFGGPGQLVLRDLPVPVPQQNEVLIKNHAFGINRAEVYMRKGLWGNVARVSGIECVGEVAADPGGELAPGTKVATMMGGLARTRNGSYAEFVSALRSHIVPIATELSWPRLAALPESYGTAWTCLFKTLRLSWGQTLVIRGATSALGLAALHLAKNAGVTVIATTRGDKKKDILAAAGAAHTVLERPGLRAEIRNLYPQGVDAALDLLGNSAVLDSLKMVRTLGAVCVAGFLGGSEPVPLDILTGTAPGVSLIFFASFLFGTPEYPVSQIPLQAVVDSVAKNLWSAEPARVYSFSDLPEAHRLMESNTANGKIVVTVN